MPANAHKPLDTRLAAWLVRPLCRTPVTPSHLTTVRLITGLGASLAFAAGPTWFMFAAWVFVISHFLDHTDGELARMSGKSSQFGHYYDLAADALVTIMLFVGLGIGLEHSSLGRWAPALGTLAGVTVSLIFWLHLETSKRMGTRAHVPKTSWFEMEDVLYLIPLVIWLKGAYWFLLAAAVGAPAFAAWLFYQYRTHPSAAKGQQT